MISVITFVLGIVIGIYVSTQMDNSINQNIKKYD